MVLERTEPGAAPVRALEEKGRMRIRPIISVFVMITIAGAVGFVAWQRFRGPALPDSIAVANGRIEAEQVQIATKLAGRVSQVLADEGQTVEAGAVVARMDATELEHELHAAEAQVRRAEKARVQAEASIAQRKSERKYAQQELQRAVDLHDKGFFTTSKLDEKRTLADTAESAYETAVAGLDAAKDEVTAGRAEVERLQSLINDTVLVAPRRGRIEYKLAESGEVLAVGQRVFTLLDLTDVYMTVFLPSSAAGRLALNDEARLILDPIPQYVIPAKVTFVAAEAQFTPKSVETAEEREKLMFRVKLTIAPDLLKQYESRVKTGVRGLAYVRVKRDTPWPENLAVKLPP